MHRRNPVVFEGLEPRELLSNVPLGLKKVAIPDGIELRIGGTYRNDVIGVSPVAGGILVKNGTWQTTVAGTFSSIVVRGNDGSDKITIASTITLRTALYGGLGNDTISGGSGADKMYGDAGNDALMGGAGNDVLVTIGGGAYDVLAGNGGNDSFWCDSPVTEKINDVSSVETAARNVHRVSAFHGIAYRTSTGGVKTYRPSLELTGGNLVDPGTDTGLTYKNFSTKPLFGAAGPSRDDVNQGFAGNCWYMCTLSSMAGANPNSIRQNVVELGDGTYAVQFTRDNGSKAYVRVDGDLPVDSSGELYYARLGREDAIWVAIMEKAYACFRSVEGTSSSTYTAKYSNLDFGWMDEALSDHGFASTTTWSVTDGNALFDLIQTQLSAGKVVTLAVDNPISGAPLVDEHAYAVCSVQTDESGARTLVLRNPWGIDGAGSDGVNDGYVRVTMAQAYGSFWGLTCAKVGVPV